MEGQKVVKVFCHEDKSIEQFKEINNRLRESANNANMVANITMPVNGNIGNKIYVDDSFLIVDLYNDLYNIQGGFSTKYFDKYNDNKDIDRKIFYIKR